MERLKGFNLGGWFSQIDCIEEKDPQIFPGFTEHLKSFITDFELELIKSAGSNHVRLPVDWFNLFNEETLELNEVVMILLEEAVFKIRSMGLLVILDLHKCPGHDFHLGTTEEQAFFTDPTCREQAKEVWRHLVERFGRDPGIYLEILNEPVAPSNALCNEVLGELHGFIRSLTSVNPIVMGSNLWNSARNFKDLDPVDDKNVLYSFHLYEPLFFTHQRAPWIANRNFHQKTSYPGNYQLTHPSQSGKLPAEIGLWDQERMREFLKPVLDFRDRTQLPVACNEFGVFLKADRVSQIHWIEDLMEIFREYDIGYSYWNFKNLDFGIVSVNESLHADLPQYKNPDRLDSELLEILSKG